MYRETQNWTTFDNRIIKMNELTHQHMSNIYYFTNYIFPQLYPQLVKNWIWFWILARFGGIVLPYHPVPEFTEERNYLQKMGYLKGNNEIVVNNEIIGSYE